MKMKTQKTTTIYVRSEHALREDPRLAPPSLPFVFPYQHITRAILLTARHALLRCRHPLDLFSSSSLVEAGSGVPVAAAALVGSFTFAVVVAVPSVTNPPGTPSASASSSPTTRRRPVVKSISAARSQRGRFHAKLAHQKTRITGSAR
jgi:hypothetical protein